jgi:hypothetical protein
MKITSLLAFFLYASIAVATDFLQTFPVTGNECAGSVAILNSGNVITAGVDYSTNDITLLMLNSAGRVQKAQRITGPGVDEAQAVIATTDGGAALIGSTTSFGRGNADGFILKLNRKGGMVWKKTFGSAADEHFVRIVQTSDRGFIVLGDIANPSTSNDVIIVKFNSRGKVLWQKTVSTPGFDHASGLGLTADQGAIAILSSDVPGGVRTVVLRLSANGRVQWSRMYGNSGLHLGLSIAEAADGSIYLTEIYNPSGAQTSGMVVSKLDSNGVPVWSRNYKSRGMNLMAAIRIQPDQSLLLSGNLSSTSGSPSQGVILNLNAAGKLLWRKRVKPDSRPVFLGLSASSSADSSILVAGCSGDRLINNMDILLLKIQATGAFQGGCSKLSKFPLSSAAFNLPSTNFVLQELQIPYATTNAAFMLSGFTAAESPVCSSE